MTATLTREHTDRVLRIYHGAGKVYDVPAAAIQGTGGSTLAALRRIAEEHIRDPELVRTLNDEKVVLQSFSDDPEDVHQQPVPPDTDFARFSDILTERTVELAASVRHVGGV